MAIVKMKGIIIAENNMGDFDKMLTMLTPGAGKISCVAKGARRPNSALLAGTQFLCFGEYVMYRGHENYIINSCDTIEVFYNIRTDLDKLNYAVEITKIINQVTNENENTYKILQLYLNTLYVISEKNLEPKLVLSIFKIKLMSYLGFKPKIEGCTKCNTKENLEYFSIKDSGIKCTNCAKLDKSSIKITPSTYVSLIYIITAPPKKLFSFELKNDSLKELEIISDIYLKDKLDW